MCVCPCYNYILQDDMTALMMASKEGRFVCVEAILQWDAQVNMWNRVCALVPRQ